MVKFRWGSALVCYATAKRGGRVTMFPNEFEAVSKTPCNFVVGKRPARRKAGDA